MSIREADNDIIFELYKLCSAVLPEKTTWSINEIAVHLSSNLKLTSKTEFVDRLKQILKELEQKQAVIFVDGFEAFNLVEPKLLELVNDSKFGKK
jgi:hypothetical protein